MTVFDVGSICERAGSVAPTRVAVTVGDRQITFAEADEAANRTANALLTLGAGAGDRVIWVGRDHMSSMIYFFAAAKAGLVFVPVNPDYGHDELAGIVDYIRPRLVIAGAGCTDLVSRIASDRALLSVVSDTELDRVAASAAPTRPDVVVDGEDIQVIFLTSGSTGLPKGAMISHRAQVLRTALSNTYSSMSGGAGSVVMFPLFHMAGYFFALRAWGRLRATHFVERPDADELMSTVERHRAEEMYCIPAVWDRVLGSTKPYDMSSLRFAPTGTSLVGPELVDAILARCPNAETSVHYGSTEMGAVVDLAPNDVKRKPMSVGLPCCGVDARISDDGELLLRGPTVFSGYFDRDDATQEALRDGWYHTGDLAERDEDGYLWITGRRKELIRSGGEWIAPVDVEQALRTHPGVAEVAVVGINDPRWGEVVCAIVVSAGADAPSVDALRAHLEGVLAPYKHPRVVLPIAELPKTAATGQTMRSSLREWATGRAFDAPSTDAG